MLLHHKFLPNRPAPKNNESLPSYLIRLTKANGLLSINDILSLLFNNFHNPLFAMDDRGPWTNGELFDSSKKFFGCGIDYNEISKCTFYNLYNNIDKSYSYFRNLSNKEKKNLLINEYKIAESLYICPYCVNEQEYINKYWGFQNIFTNDFSNKKLACLTHKTNLINSCPICNNDFSYDQFFISMKFCLSCGHKFDKYNLPKNSSSIWILKGNYLLLEILNSEEVSLPYLPREKSNYINLKKPPRQLEPYNFRLWSYYFKALGTDPDFLEQYDYLLRTKTEIEIYMSIFAENILNYNDYDYDFGYNAFNNKLKNIIFFPDLLWIN